MKFGLFFANAGPFANPELFEVLVRGADDVGFESIWAVEHVVVPVGYRSQYPYREDARAALFESIAWLTAMQEKVDTHRARIDALLAEGDATKTSAFLREIIFNG